jgi:hypothetical protein
MKTTTTKVLMHLVLASLLLLGICPPATATSSPPRITEPPTTSDDLRRRQAAAWDTCGYADGNLFRSSYRQSTHILPGETLTCASGTCGILVVFGRETAHLGCCGLDGCAMPTRCIETGSATDTMVLEW